VKNKMLKKTTDARNIGLNVKVPSEHCDDRSCPFHGTLSIRGQIITGIVSSTKMQNSIVVKREYSHYIPKYDRYEKRTNKYAAHCPPCLRINVGDKVRISECKPLSKTISFVVVEKI
jgi:small subunit ribosomal protein S17